jgi:hypothetical protein
MAPGPPRSEGVYRIVGTVVGVPRPPPPRLETLFERRRPDIKTTTSRTIGTEDERGETVARKNVWLGSLGAIALMLAMAGPGAAAEHRLGLGLHYWQSIDELAKDFPGVEDSGVSWVGSYQLDPVGLFKFNLDLEYFRDGFGGSEGSALAPQVLALIGGKLYGGVGVGQTFSSSFENNRSSAYFIGRLGLDFALLPRLRLDLNLNYQADAFNELDEADTGALTLGVVARFTLSSGNRSSQ